MDGRRSHQLSGEAVDVRPYLRNSHIFVLPSYREGTPKSTLEAMAMGLPIITTDVPGCRETVIQGFNGLIVPVKNGGSRRSDGTFYPEPTNGRSHGSKQ